MNAPTANLSVCVGDKMVVIKIAGRASFGSSVDFKTLIVGLWSKGYGRFVLDLTECILMDSTFLGVLAGLGLKFEKAAKNKARIELFHPSDRVADLLENLGVSHLFRVLSEDQVVTGPLAPVAPPEHPPSAEELSRTCLQAHQTLMDINPANVPKFKDVAKFLEEDLEK